MLNLYLLPAYSSSLNDPGVDDRQAQAPFDGAGAGRLGSEIGSEASTSSLYVANKKDFPDRKACILQY